MALIGPYTRVRLPFISAKLNIAPADVEQLLVQLILDGRVDGHVDQVWLNTVLTAFVGLNAVGTISTVVWLEW